MHIAALYRYPVKSLGGQSVAQAAVEPLGLAGDRRWMIVDPDGRFLTRRQIPHLARIAAHPHPLGVELHRAGAAPLVVRFPDRAAPARPVTIWSDRVEAQPGGNEADAWLAQAVGRPLHLVYQPDHCPRPVSPKYARPDDRVSFADGFPLLVTTEESLAALNAALGEPVVMERFRPNIVLAGAPAPWAEDEWRRLRLGPITLRIAKPCVRCVVTTQDPATGAPVGDGHEPLRTLRALGRRTKSGIVFGQNAIPDGGGTLAVGDDVTVIETGPSMLVPLPPRAPRPAPTRD